MSMSYLKKIWNKWKEIAEKIGNFQAAVIFSVLYYLIIVPIGLVANFISDYFSEKAFPVWHEMEDNSSTIGKLKEQ